MNERRATAIGRRALLGAAGTTIATAVAGCGRFGVGDDTPVESPTETVTEAKTVTERETDPSVHVVTNYDTEAWMERWETELVPDFRTETGTAVEVESAIRETTYRLRPLLEGGNPPDLVTGSVGQILDVASMADLEPVTAILEGAQSINGDLVVEPFGHDGEYWQVPHGYQAATFQYRADVYEQLGLDVPTSFQGVLDNARAIDESGLDFRGYGLPGMGSEKSRDEFQLFLAGMGVSPIGLRWADPDDRTELEIHFPEDEVTTLLAFFSDLAQYCHDPTELDYISSMGHWLSNDPGGQSTDPETTQLAQQIYWNNALGTTTASVARHSDDEGLPVVVESTHITTVPTWETGGVGREDSWLARPIVDGFHHFAAGDNPAGAREWLRWLYADDTRRTAGHYPPPLTHNHLLPVYGDVISSETYRASEMFSAWPRLLEQVEYVQETVVPTQYGTVAEADLTDPVSQFVGQQSFYGKMVRRVVTGEDTPQAAYEWGRRRLADHLQTGRARFR